MMVTTWTQKTRENRLPNSRQMSPPAYQHSAVYMVDAMPATHPTNVTINPLKADLNHN